MSLTVPKPYLSFLVHFHGDRDYFECHEILEEYWKEVAHRERDSHWVGLIQLAVACYHDRRGNTSGAIRMMTKSVNNLRKKRLELTQLGLDADELFVLLEQTKTRMTARKPYKDINLPLIDKDLIKQCVKECERLTVIWCDTGSTLTKYILHKHIARDRSDIILARQQQLHMRTLK